MPPRQRRDESSWREILEYFEPAFQLGMTATPLRDDNRDTYDYFGNPIYTYSLRQGIEDGFLAPYRVHRVVTDVDAAGLAAEQGRAGPLRPRDPGRRIPDQGLRARRRPAGAHPGHRPAPHRLPEETDRFAKTIVFCVDQEHAAEMRAGAGQPEQPIWSQQYPDYVCRVTADEGDIGRGHLSHFQDVDKPAPVILTTSQLLTTGVDAPTCKNVVLARVVGSMIEFKQIIGRGTRVRVDYGKLCFNILDYTGTATRHFADPDFDGDPARLEEVTVDEAGEVVDTTIVEVPGVAEPEAEYLVEPEQAEPGAAVILTDPPAEPRKFYFDGGQVEIVGHLVYELDPDGKQLQVVRYTDYAGRAVRSLYPTRDALQAAGPTLTPAADVLRELTERGISFDELAAAATSPMPTPSTCSATWPSTPRCGRGASAPSARARPRRTSLRSTATRPARCCRCCSTSTPSTATPSSTHCPTC